VGDAQSHVFAPRWRDNLHRDRQRLQDHGHCDHRQTDEGDRLRKDANIGSQGQLDTIEIDALLPKARRGEWRGWRQNSIEAVK
jgi:hypothetical protein